MKTNEFTSPSYLLQKLIEDKSGRLTQYKSKQGASQNAIKMMEDEIIKLSFILDQIRQIEPAGLLTEIANTLKRNALLDVDITCLLIPNRLNIPKYQHAKVMLSDLTICNFPDLTAVYEMHAEGKLFCEVDDYTGNDIDNILKAYANRGDLI